MKTIVCGLIIALSVSAFAQQQGQLPHTTPPTFPPEQREQHPPDTKAPAPGEMSSAEVEDAIQEAIEQAPVLKDSEVRVAVDDNFVVLEGTATKEQRDVALGIAQAHAGEREVIDKLQVRRRT